MEIVISVSEKMTSVGLSLAHAHIPIDALPTPTELTMGASGMSAEELAALQRRKKKTKTAVNLQKIDDLEVDLGLGRIVALCYRSSVLYKIH